MRVTIPTLDEIVAAKHPRQIAFDAMIQVSGATESQYGPRFDKEGVSKIQARYERWLSVPEISVRFGAPTEANLHADSPLKELYVFGERDLKSGLYAVHRVLKSDPNAINVFAELDGAQTDQLQFDAAMKYAARIGLQNPLSHLVRVISSGKKSYELR